MLEYKCDKMGREILLKVSGNTLKELIINAIAALEKEQDLIELLSKSGRLLLRVVLCLMPQNLWTSAEAPLSWGIYRNIPFAILGAVIVILFYRSARIKQDKTFRFLWLAVVISFGCYIPVVLFADLVPPVGMLMIPKTCAYVWVVLIGYKAMKGSNGK